MEAYGDGQALLGSIEDPSLRRFAEINYGPWDRLAGNEPFIEGVGPKPSGANFYPPDMTREEFEEAISTLVTQAEMLCEATLDEADIDPSDVKSVFFAGGSTRWWLDAVRVASWSASARAFRSSRVPRG